MGNAAMVLPDITLMSAAAFSMESLATAYNQTRVDYIVPMPMNAARLAAYMRLYDVDVAASVVALDGDTIVGLAMLGVRSGRAWITRLGVLPNCRKHGVGRLLMDALLHAAAEHGRPLVTLEVIVNNEPAHQLFLRCDFREVNRLLVLRRPPGAVLPALVGNASWFGRFPALDVLKTRPGSAPWTNDVHSFNNAKAVEGVHVMLPNGDNGWAIFQREMWVLSHIVVHTISGDPVQVGIAALSHIHNRYADMDTHAENISVDDPHCPAFTALGYVEAFRRIEMDRHPQAHTSPAITTRKVL